MIKNIKSAKSHEIAFLLIVFKTLEDVVAVVYIQAILEN